MFDKIKTLQKHPALVYLRDARAWGLIVFGIIILLVSWSGIKAIQTNYGLQKQISKLQQENDVQKLTNDNLNLQNQYYQTDQFLELAARRQFGLGAPGEKLLIVPKNVALSYTIDLPSAAKKVVSTTNANQPFYRRNLQAWMHFLFRKS